MRRLPDLEELAGCRSWLIVVAALIPLHQELVEEVGGCLGFSVALPDDVDRGVASHIQAVNPVGSGSTLVGACWPSPTAPQATLPRNPSLPLPRLALSQDKLSFRCLLLKLCGQKAEIGRAHV